MRRAKGEELRAEITAIGWLLEMLRAFRMPEEPQTDFRPRFEEHLKASPFGDEVHPEALIRVWEQVPYPEDEQGFQLLLSQLQCMYAKRRKRAVRWP